MAQLAEGDPSPKRAIAMAMWAGLCVPACPPHAALHADLFWKLPSPVAFGAVLVDLNTWLAHLDLL